MPTQLIIRMRSKYTMRKFKLVLVTMIMSVMVAGCGKDEAESGSKNETTAAATEAAVDESTEAGSDETAVETSDEYFYTLDGTKVLLNSKMEDVVAAIGEPDKYFESESCAFQGLDKVYTYGSVVITTYPDNEVDYVYTIDLKDDTVETDEGLFIGASKEDVEAAYGTPGDKTDIAYIYTKGDTKLTIIFEDDCVAGITYSYVTE